MLPRHACVRGSFFLPAGLLWISDVVASSHDPGGVILAGAVIKSSAPAGASPIHYFPAEQFRNQLEAGRLLFLVACCLHWATVLLWRAPYQPREAHASPQARSSLGALHYDYVPPLTQCNFHIMFINYHNLFTNIYFPVHNLLVSYIYRETGRGKIIYEYID